MSSARGKSAGWQRAMSSGSANSFTPCLASLRRATRPRGSSFAVSLLFATHPAEVDLAVEEAPEVVVDLARLADLAWLPLLAQVADLAMLEVVAELAVEEVSVEAVHRSFSPAVVGNLPSTGTPRYSPVPRSGRKAKRRP
jgi:hypothetical protein